MIRLYQSKTWLMRRVKEGLSNKEIGDICGVSAEIIRQYKKRYGIR